ncbi:TPA: phage/plasmid replication protein, II/X family, partial [Acinetobacter baumannii]
SNSKFYENLKDILDCDFCSKFELQNLKSIDEKNVVPFLKLIEIDFSNQLPSDYVEPKSNHAHIYKHLIPNFSKAS